MGLVDRTLIKTKMMASALSRSIIINTMITTLQVIRISQRLPDPS